MQLGGRNSILHVTFALTGSRARFLETISLTGIEVDFVLYGERGLHAFEAKRAGRLRSSDHAGLRAPRGSACPPTRACQRHHQVADHLDVALRQVHLSE